MNEYFITYFFKMKSNQTGFGNISLDTDTPISSPADIKEITDYIRKTTGVDDVVVLNWKRYEV